MAYGVLVESMIQANNIDALNRSAVAGIDVAGGGLVALSYPTTKGDDVWTATAPATGALQDLWMAYNPEAKYLTINGKKYAGLSLSWDLRDYTNIKGDVFDVFQPQIGDEILITQDCVDDPATNWADVAAGVFLEAQNGKTTFAVNDSTVTASVMAFEVEWVGTAEFPKGDVGIEYYPVCKAVRVQ